MNRADCDRSDARCHSRRRTARRRVAALLVALALALRAAAAPAAAGHRVPRSRRRETYTLAGFQPAAPVAPGRPRCISFTIQQPSGKPLTAYRKCCEPHAGVDLIIVRERRQPPPVRRLRHRRPTAGSRQPVMFPAPGRYRVHRSTPIPRTEPRTPADQLPAVHQRHRHAAPTTPADAAVQARARSSTATTSRSRATPQLHAIQAAFLTVKVTDPARAKPMFGTWLGALAHAIFIHEGSLDYFHTHVCSPGRDLLHLRARRDPGHRQLEPPRDQLKVGVLLPEPGTWRMFLLTYMQRAHITAPYHAQGQAHETDESQTDTSDPESNRAVVPRRPAAGRVLALARPGSRALIVAILLVRSALG